MDDTVVNVNPIRRYQEGEAVDPKVPTYMKYLMCFQAFMNTTMVLLAWLLCLAVLGTVIWAIIKHS
jgi:hypothetical protein